MGLASKKQEQIIITEDIEMEIPKDELKSQTDEKMLSEWAATGIWHDYERLQEY